MRRLPVVLAAVFLLTFPAYAGDLTRAIRSKLSAGDLRTGLSRVRDLPQALSGA